MIAVVEGVSAAGKTAWCRQQCRTAVPELPRMSPPAEEVAAAHFWTEAHARRWAEAVRLELENRRGICDTDPFKLHYSWCLWRIGCGTRGYWAASVEAFRAMVRSERIGFADVIVLLEPPAEQIRRQKDADMTRRRGAFELHLRLAPALREWYALLESLTPGRLRWHGEALSGVDEVPVRDDRYSLELFEALVSEATRRAA